MSKAAFGQYQHVYIVGIGGAGMSAIARVLLGRGLRVSGADSNPASAASLALSLPGAVIYPDHAAENIADADVVLITSATRADNPEVAAAHARGIPVLKRREALPLLMADSLQITVAGTHGKTTTTALIAHLLSHTQRDPSYIVGGVLQNTGDNAHAGAGDCFVIEADEYDYMFLGLTPTIAVLTNIEHDHPDMFATLADVQAAFAQFVARIPEYDGVLIACADDPLAFALAQQRRASGQPTLTYGLRLSADWVAREDSKNGQARVHINGREAGKPVGAVLEGGLPPALAGKHNLQNALAALAACVGYGVPLNDLLPGLASFKGTGRRLEVLGERDGITLISDYGHHPTAIRATLEALRRRYPQAKRLWAVWQPHTFSRTRLLAADFAAAFAQADRVLVTEIYAARETAQPTDPSGESMAAQITASGHNGAAFGGNLAETATRLQAEAAAGDVIVIFSAGDAPKIGKILLGQA
jgi:UDP-N-acetylmuramate--alanine ligase